MRSLVFLIAILVPFCTATRAGEPFFKPNDVIALVGGEDMVVAAELGYLETLIQLALPEHRLKFRSLAREGDTVFEQRRDLNYPSLEAQLDKMGATVVICQFGQMESLAAGSDFLRDRGDERDPRDPRDKRDAGKADVPLVPLVPSVPQKADALQKAKVAEFAAAYEKLIGRLSGGKRRIAIMQPGTIEPLLDSLYEEKLQAYRDVWKPYFEAVRKLAESKPNTRYVNIPRGSRFGLDVPLTRDGVHFDILGQYAANRWTTAILTGLPSDGEYWSFGKQWGEGQAALRQLIAAKNRLWFHYYRPQNWAFLAGDRTNQPSSRDHLDPSKRWFPEELEKFVPLIDAKDAEIWALAKKLAAQGGK